MNTTENEHELAGLRGIAAALRIPSDWLRAEADAGRVPCLRIGRKRYFNLSAVRAALAERAATERQGATP
jgi:hypothetical protein